MTNVDVDCTDEELEGFLDRVLSLQRYETLDGDNTTTDIGIVSLITNYMHAAIIIVIIYTNLRNAKHCCEVTSLSEVV